MDYTNLPILYTVIYSYLKNYMTLCYEQTRHLFFFVWKFSVKKKKDRVVQENSLLILIFMWPNIQRKKKKKIFFHFLIWYTKNLKKKQTYTHLLLGHFQSSVMLLEMEKCKMEASVLATLWIDTEIKAFYRESICIHSGFQNYFHPLTALESVYL